MRRRLWLRLKKRLVLVGRRWVVVILVVWRLLGALRLSCIFCLSGLFNLGGRLLMFGRFRRVMRLGWIGIRVR